MTPRRTKKPLQQSELWILNATLVTQDSNRSVFPGCLRIVDGLIAEIRKKPPKKLPRGSKKIDAKGKFILPGFVQTHVHLCQTLFRNQADDLELMDWLSKRIWLFEAAHTEATLEISAQLGIRELLGGGTTCILDMATVHHTEAILEVVKKTGIRANIGKCLMDHPETSPKGLIQKSKAALKEAADLFSKWNGTERDRIRVSFAPRFVVSCTEGLLAEVRDLAKSENAIIHTHASENPKELEIVRALVGSENIEYLHKMGLTGPRLNLAHCIWLQPFEMQILKETGTHVTHCPSSNLKLASGIARVPEMLDAGINVSLGADGAPCNNNLNMFTEMRLAALIHKPGNGPRTIRAQDSLDMATLNGAKALGLKTDIGSIETGKKADLIALDLSQIETFSPTSFGKSCDRDAIASAIVYSASPSNVAWSMVDGKMVFSKEKGLKSVSDQTILRGLPKAWKAIEKRARL